MHPSHSFSQLHPGATEAHLTHYLAASGPLPAAYLHFLRHSDGADTPLHHPPETQLRLHPIATALQLNPAYQIQQHLPHLWMIGDDHGDNAYCLHRIPHLPPDQWPIIEVSLGALFEDELTPISPDFTTWAGQHFQIPQP